MERTLWHLGLRGSRICDSTLALPSHVLLGRGNSFVFDFLFVVLGCWDVGHDKREIPFLSEWSFCFQGNSSYPFSIQSGVSHLFLRTASRERRFPFLTKFSAVCHYGSCFLLFFSSSFSFTTVAYWRGKERTAGKDER